MIPVARAERDQKLAEQRQGSGPWADLALTFPILVAYHVGVYFLPVRNAADMVTRELVVLSKDSPMGYLGLTAAIATAFASVLVLLGRGQAFRAERFVFVALEAVIYAAAMRLIASYVVGELYLANAEPGGGAASQALERYPMDGLTGFVMSTGAGFYEELVFRVLLYGVGIKLLLLLVSPGALMRPLVIVGWAVAAAAVFSGWHYVGEFGDEFEARSFVFRWVCGLVFTIIYQFRGFAPAVWTHALYDIWVLVL